MGTSAVESIETKLINSKFRPSGFDYLRLILAISVVISHAPVLSGGAAAGESFWSGPMQGPLKAILPMFFALSGFLVSGSLERCRTLFSFMGLRVIRIYPALIVEVFLSALIFGPLVTQVALGKYFTDPEFLRYLANISGEISYYLPGVFADNPYPRVVNGQLWTVKWELACYAVLGMVYLSGPKRLRHTSLIAVFAMSVLDVAFSYYRGRDPFAITAEHLNGRILVVFFLAGVCFYVYKSLLPVRNWMILFSAAISWVLLVFVPGGTYLSVIPLTYFTVAVGVLNFERGNFVKLADYSYGIFLYGFSIQQFVSYLFPWSHTWYANLLISLPICVLVGALSWHLVEKPIVGQRSKLVSLENKLFPART